jgi:hypothetical protein
MVVESSVVDAGSVVRGPLSPIALSYAAGLRGRANPFSDGRALLGLSLEYAFTQIGPTGAPDAELPGVAYRALRAGVDLRFTLGRFAIFAAGAGEQMLEPGTISPSFFAPNGFGVTGEGGFGLLVGRHFDLRAVGRYRRYMFAFSTPPGALFGHGNAIDEIYDARLAVAFYFGGY